VPCGAGEAEIAAFVAAWLRDAGLEVVVDDPPGTGDPPRPSVRASPVVEVVGHTAWMDAAILSAAGVPTVVFGPGGAGAHAVEEWVDLAEVEHCARTLAAVAAGWCR
jgi:acetylornithine deacetylase/succinyl-diaminopimelate desuccinylase-like protein